MRYTQSQKAVANFSLATSKKYNGKEETQWHNITVWGNVAENCNKYLSAGDQVFVTGEITYRSYEKKDGTKAYSTDIVAHSVNFIRTKGQQNNQQGGFPPNQPQQPSHSNGSLLHASISL